MGRRCEHDPAFRWLTGLALVNHHTLSDFRVAHRVALDDLFTQLLGVLSAEGLIALDTVAHDGTKVAPDASRGPCQGEAQIERHLEAARSRAKWMGDPRDEAVTARVRAARERAGRDRVARLEQALAAVRRIQAAKHPWRAKTGKRAGRARAPPIPRRGSCSNPSVTRR